MPPAIRPNLRPKVFYSPHVPKGSMVRIGGLLVFHDAGEHFIFASSVDNWPVLDGVPPAPKKCKG